jgi:ATP-dependent Lon protease
VKEQLNKRKKDEEFGEIQLGYVNTRGETVEVHCPESVGIAATLNPRSGEAPAAEESTPLMTNKKPAPAAAPTSAVPPPQVQTIPSQAEPEALTDKHFTIRYGDTGYSYRSIFGQYLQGAKGLVVEDPYIRREHQIRNFLQLCELAVQIGTIKVIDLVTSFEHEAQKEEAEKRLEEIKEGLADFDIAFTYRFDEKIHDREIRTDTGWHIQIGRGLDIYQGPISRLRVGVTNFDLRSCMETKVNIHRNF